MCVCGHQAAEMWELFSIAITPTPYSVCCAQTLSCVQLFATPWTVAHQSSVHGILSARILEWVATSSFRGSSRPRHQIKTLSLQILYYQQHLGSPTQWNPTNTSFINRRFVTKDKSLPPNLPTLLVLILYLSSTCA